MCRPSGMSEVVLFREQLGKRVGQADSIVDIHIQNMDQTPSYSLLL